MKLHRIIGTSILVAASLVTTASGQIQVAGTLQVDVDATDQPAGALTYLTNSGALGGVFLANNNGVAGVTPQIIALGGSGTRGVLLDGNCISLRHYTDTSGSTVMLPPAGLVGGAPVFSVEAWMYKPTVTTETGPVAWGTRSDGQNVSCNWGRHLAWGGFSWQGGSWDYGWNTYPTPGVWHHLVWTYDGAGNLNLYRDGVLDKAAFQSAAVNVNPDYNIVLGAQHNGTAWTGFANGVLAKVRIHDGVLTPTQIAGNYAYEAGGFVNGTPAQDLAAAPLHRYSFNLPPTNNAVGLTVADTGTAFGTAAQADGVIKGNANTAYFDGLQLYMAGGASASAAYVDLPNGLLSSLSSSNGGPGQVTFEMWVNPTAQNWARLLDFGSNTVGEITAPGGSFNGQNVFLMNAQEGGNQERSGVRGVAGDRGVGSRLIDFQKHVVATWDELNNVIKLYHQGVLVGQFAANTKMNSVRDVNNWLGRSNWSGDANFGGTFREFRIYGRVLTEAEVRRNYLVGPADIDSATLVWNGNTDGNWNTGTANWLADATSSVFADGSSVRLDDSATGTTTLSLSGTLSPKSLTVANETKSYTLGGSGKLSGTASLIKEGVGTLTMAGTQANDYTGPTLLLGGKTVVSALANAGLPSPLGAANADPTNLVLSGTLSYQGPSTTLDRGILVAGPLSTLEVLHTLTLTGVIRGGGVGGLTKAGPGTLVYTASGSNVISGGFSPGLKVAQGTVVFDGTASGGIQTNRNMSDVWVGGTLDYGGNMIISNSTFLSDSWVSIGRGNGSVGNLSTLTLENGHIWIAANGLAMGFVPAGIATNFASQMLALNGTSTIYAPGNVNVGESSGSSASVYLNGSSWLRGSTIRLGISAGSTGALYIANSTVVTNANYTSIGTAAATAVYPGGAGTMVIKDNGGFYSASDFNVSDVGNASGGSVGQLDLMNNATLTTGNLFVGKGQNCAGVLNQSGGTLAVLGTFANIGSAAASAGTLNVSGGVFGMTNATGNLFVGASGTGILNVNNTGVVNVPNGLCLGNAIGASGTVNLDGGTISAKRVYMGNAGASSTFNFNGGVLKAADGANPDFMSGLSWASVMSGGARIDTGSNNITIGQELSDGGGGSLTKLGSGTLKLAGNVTYAGPTVISAGKLEITTAITGQSPHTLADGTSLGVQLMAPGSFITVPNLTVGSATGAALDFDLGNFGNPSAAPLSVSGTLTLNGATTVNIVPTSTMAVGTVPLISYVAPKAGAGSFTLGTLPPGVAATLIDNGAGSVYLNVTSVSLPRWDGQVAGGVWDVGQTTNWVDRLTLQPMFFQQGFSTLFDDSALGTTSVTLNTTVVPGGVLVSNSTLNYTISGTGRIGGNSGLTKQGTGLLTISTANNTYSGATVVEGGTLATTAPNNLGSNSALTMISGTLSLGTNNQRFSTVTVTNGSITASGATVTAAGYQLAGGNITATLAGGSLATIGTNNDVASVLGLNTYTGPTILAGNPLLVTNLANGGSPSGVGAASADPTNLVFSGGTLTYAGAPAVTDRGYTVAAGGTFSAVGDLTLVGPVAANAGSFTKSGPASLMYARLGTNLLSSGGYYVGQGALVFNGGAGTPGNYLQTNRIVGELWVGFDQVNAGAMVLTNSSLGIGAWLAIDRGNGTVGSSSRVTLYDSVLTAGNFSMGYANNIAGNSSFPVLALLGNSSFTVNARTFIGENGGADATIIIGGTSRYTQSSEWFALGNSGKGTLVLSNTARANFPGDCNLGDVAGGDGTLNIYDNATNLALTLYVGKGNDSGPATGVVNQHGGYVGKSATGGGDWRIGGNSSTATAGSVGTYNLYGGVFEPQNNFQIGSWGTGYWNQYGGIANCASWPAVGRYPGSYGFMTVSGGVFNQTATGNRLIIAEEGTGTLTITNTGLVTSANGVSIGHQATGVGVVNLDGGTLRTTIVLQPVGGGSSTFNFNGGVLQAGANNATFMTGLGSANVLARGAVIDSAGFNITIAQPLLEDASSPGGGLTKLGAGTLALSGANTFTGPTVVSNGTLRVNGSIVGTATVRPGATLGGNGVISGAVTVQAGGALGAGDSIGTLTLNSSPVLAGAVVAELDRNGGSPLADRIVVSGNPIAYGGTLVVTNTGAPLQVGDTFTLFSASGYSGGFTLVSQTPGQGVSWNTANLTVNGSISVASVTNVSVTPPDIGVGRTGNTLNLTWPSDRLGWTLQTNAVGVSAVNAWFPYPGSKSFTNANINIDPGVTNLFLRLVYP